MSIFYEAYLLAVSLCIKHWNALCSR